MPLRIFKRFKPQAAKNPASTDLQAKFERALSLNKEQLFAEATAVCREIIALAPSHIETLILLAEITASKGEPERAIELYDKVIELKPDGLLQKT
jgi:tetratricopeptide (TPR) repeat protein